MNIMILVVFLFYIMLILVYEYKKDHYILTKCIEACIFIGMGMMVYHTNHFFIKGGSAYTSIYGSNERAYQRLQNTIQNILDITTTLYNTQEEIETEITRIQNTTQPIITPLSLPDHQIVVQSEEEIIETSSTPYPVAVSPLEKAITIPSFKLDTTDPYISECIQRGRSSLPYLKKNPIHDIKWKPINQTTYECEDRQLQLIPKESMSYIWISHDINQRKSIFPKVYGWYEEEQTVYVEMEKIDRTMETILTKQLPETVLHDMHNVSKSDIPNILYIYKRKLPNRDIDIPPSLHEEQAITFNKHTYTQFIKTLQKEYAPYMQRINAFLKQSYKYLVQEKWFYGSLLCRDIGIRDDESIVWTRPINHLIYDPMHQSYTNYTAEQHSLDGSYILRILQAPIDSSKYISSTSSNVKDLADILQMKVYI